MKINLDQVSLQLQPQRMLRVHEGKGTQVRCTSGSLWITQEGDSRDVVLRAGESLTLRKSGLTLIMAPVNSQVELHQHTPAAA